MTAIFGGQLRGQLSAQAEFVNPGKLVSRCLDWCDGGHALVLFDEPGKLRSKRVLHMSSLGDMWRQVGSRPLAVQLKFDEESRSAILVFSHAPLPPSLVALDAKLNPTWVSSTAEDVYSLFRTLPTRYPDDANFRSAVEHVRQRELHGVPIRTSSLFPLSPRATPSSATATATPKRLSPGLLDTLGGQALAVAIRSGSGEGHQHDFVSWYGTTTTVQVSFRLNATEADELATDEAWTGSSGTTSSVPRVSAPYQSNSLSYLETDGLYGHLVPKNWATAAAVATMVGSHRSASWGAFVQVDGAWRNIAYVRAGYGPVPTKEAVPTVSAVREAIKLRFGLTLRPTSDATKLGSAHPAQVFTATPGLRRPLLAKTRPDHSQLVKLLRSVNVDRGIFAVASHREALIDLLVTTRGCSVFGDREAATAVVKKEYGKRDAVEESNRDYRHRSLKAADDETPSRPQTSSSTTVRRKKPRFD